MLTNGLVAKILAKYHMAYDVVECNGAVDIMMGWVGLDASAKHKYLGY